MEYAVPMTSVRVLGMAIAFAAVLAAPVTASPPRYDHVMIVIEENHSAFQVLDSPYFSSLAGRGVLLTHSYAVAHPSEPNYIALFSGSTQGVTDDRRHDLTEHNLATSLVAAGLTAAGYSEGLPWTGFRGDTFGAYVRKHNPFAIFSNLPGEENQPFSAFPKGNFGALPTVCLVIPDLRNDMHDGTVGEADTWLRNNIEPFAAWAPAHDSLLIVTFDEGEGSHDPATDPIATVLVGSHLKPGTMDTPVTHYSVLRLIEDIYGLPYLGQDRSAAVIDGIWD